MTRVLFEQHLSELRSDVVDLGSRAEEAIRRAMESLRRRDLTLARAVVEGDYEINRSRFEIEDRAVNMIATQQPMATDLRAIVTAIRMVAEIERSGDLVVNIMKGARRMYGTEFDPRLRGLIERLGEEVHRLFRMAIDAYVDRDAGLAAALDDMDDAVDSLHAEYIASIFESHDRKAIPLQAAVQLALVGRYYERIADHAVNIGERVAFMVTGEFLDDRQAAGSE